ncbi:hypothetical protein [Roseiflexus sp.]
MRIALVLTALILALSACSAERQSQAGNNQPTLEVAVSPTAETAPQSSPVPTPLPEVAVSPTAETAPQSSPVPTPPPADAQSSLDCAQLKDDLSIQLGVTLKLIEASPTGMWQSCDYADHEQLSMSTVRIIVSVVTGMPSAEEWRRISNPPGTVWRPVPGDPDGAVVLESIPDNDPFPVISYERKGWIVEIKALVEDVSLTFGEERERNIAKWQQKLLALKRFPE